MFGYVRPAFWSARGPVQTAINKRVGRLGKQSAQGPWPLPERQSPDTDAFAARAGGDAGVSDPRGVTRATGAGTSADSDLTSGSDATGVTGRRQCGSPCGGPVAGHYL